MHKFPAIRILGLFNHLIVDILVPVSLDEPIFELNPLVVGQPLDLVPLLLLLHDFVESSKFAFLKWLLLSADDSELKKLVFLGLRENLHDGQYTFIVRAVRNFIGLDN